MTESHLEKIIISGLLHNMDFSKKVMPYTKSMFFASNTSETVIDIILDYTETYSSLPSKDAIEIELDSKKGMSEETYKNTKVLIDKIYDNEIIDSINKIDKEWLLEKTESYYKQQSCHIAVLEAISIIEGDSKLSPESIPLIMEDALRIEFNINLGHDYFKDSDARYEYYHRTDVKVPFLLKAMNDITGGGASRKSLIVPVAPTGVGKSFFMTAWSAYLLQNGYNVAYITLEMAEEKIGERIDANLMDVRLNDLNRIPKNIFDNKINKMKQDYNGILKIKEEPSATFTVAKLRTLLHEYKQKDNFVPDVIMIDYLNLVKPMRGSPTDNSYTALKNVAEELRSLALEMDLIICSPSQTNRDAFGLDDFNLTELSESMGIAHTADFMFGMIETPELAADFLMRLKQLKNRWGDINAPSSFMVSTNKAKMQLYDSDDISKLVGHGNNKLEDKSTSNDISKLKDMLANKEEGITGLIF